MTEPRLSTVFDYSDLRLHPDGTRVYQKSTNLRPRIAKVAVRTSRNNWIARDAGGLTDIRKFKRVKETSQDPQGDEEFVGSKTGTDSPMPEDQGEGFKERRKKRKTKRFDGRKAKRQKFLENYDYLNNNVSTSSNLAPDAGTEYFPYEPSSDLLKCIHRYASEYYTESGQLLNSSREYRRQRKIRRDKKKAKSRTKTSISPTNSRNPSPNDDSLASESETSTRDGDYENEGDSEVDQSKSKEKDKAQRKGRKRTAKQYRDMYKVFDGSAIMAIGMLVQEYIAEVLDPQPSGEWEEEMRKAFTTGCTSEDEGDAVGVDIDDVTGSHNFDGELDADEQDQDDGDASGGKSSSRNDSEGPDDKKESNDDSSSTSPRSPVEDEVPEDCWAISDHLLNGRRVPQTFQADKSPDHIPFDLVSDDDDPIESSSDKSIPSDDPEDPSAENFD